jgi:hypothetical protein
MDIASRQVDHIGEKNSINCSRGAAGCAEGAETGAAPASSPKMAMTRDANIRAVFIVILTTINLRWGRALAAIRQSWLGRYPWRGRSTR